MTSKGKSKHGYVYALYGGCMKLGFVRYGATDNEDPEDEFEKFKDVYGLDIKARYIKVVGLSTDAFKKLIDHLKTVDGIHNYGNIYELNIKRAVTEMKTVCNVKKAHTWGLDNNDDDDEDDAAATSNEPTKASTQKKADDKQVKKTVVKGSAAKEIDTEEPEDDEDEDAEDAEDDTHAKTTKNTKSVKVASVPASAKAAPKAAKTAPVADVKKAATKK